MKRVQIEEKLFQNHFHILYNCSLKEAQKWLCKYIKVPPSKLLMGHEGNSGVTFHIKDSDGIMWHFIWLRKFNWSIDDQRTLAHELFHLSGDNLRKIGLHHNKQTEEIYAYYFDYFLGEALTALKKEHPKLKR